MDALTLALLIMGAVFFLLALPARTAGMFDWKAAGLFCWILTAILSRL